MMEQEHLDDPEEDEEENGDEKEHVKVGVLLGSLTSALLAVVVLRSRNRTYRRLHERETRDDDGDGVPDVYQA